MKRFLLIAASAILFGTAWAGDYENGVSAYERKDYVQSHKFFQMSGAQQDAKVQYAIGSMFFMGQGVSQNYAEALKWFKLAAAQNNVAAQHNLGSMFQYGQRVAQD